LRSILKGETGPLRDIVVLNSAAALVAADQAKDIREGATKASEAIDAGEAKKRLELFVAATQRFGE
jgi:anthranilate phosphoribosyltransferase